MIKELLQDRGRQRRLKKERERLLLEYSPIAWRTYKPHLNRKKKGVVKGLFLISLLIPFTTAPLFIAVKSITKHKPLFFFT